MIPACRVRLDHSERSYLRRLQRLKPPLPAWLAFWENLPIVTQQICLQ